MNRVKRFPPCGILPCLAHENTCLRTTSAWQARRLVLVLVLVLASRFRGIPLLFSGVTSGHRKSSPLSRPWIGRQPWILPEYKASFLERRMPGRARTRHAHVAQAPDAAGAFAACNVAREVFSPRHRLYEPEAMSSSSPGGTFYLCGRNRG